METCENKKIGVSDPAYIFLERNVKSPFLNFLLNPVGRIKIYFHYHLCQTVGMDVLKYGQQGGEPILTFSGSNLGLLGKTFPFFNFWKKGFLSKDQSFHNVMMRF